MNTCFQYREHKNKNWFNTVVQNLIFHFAMLFSCLIMSDSLWAHGLQHTRPPCPSPSPRACSNSCPLSRWCHPTISSSVITFSCLHSFPASGFLTMSALLIMWPKYWSFSFNIVLQKYSKLKSRTWINFRQTLLIKCNVSTTFISCLYYF